MRRYITSIFPSLATTLSLFILPVLLVVYFLVTQYSNKFVAEQNIDYFEVQNNWLGRVFLDQQWVQWFNRFMDFALWGLLAIVVLVGLWMVSSAKVAIKNHYIEESFTNFHLTRNTWHSRFYISIFIKLMLVFAIAYSTLALVGRTVPRLSVNIAILLQDFNVKDLFTALLTGFSMIAFQFVIITCLKIFQHVRI